MINRIHARLWNRPGRTAAAFLLLLPMLLTLFGPVRAGAENLNASGVVNRQSAVDLIGKTEGYSAVLYDNTNGLPTSEANAIAETGEGFIWIGSYSGLIRYDGNSFVRMDSTTGITNAICLYVDHLDRLWIGTNDNGVKGGRNERRQHPGHRRG